jgi:hypothetical protein
MEIDFPSAATLASPMPLGSNVVMILHLQKQPIAEAGNPTRLSIALSQKTSRI